MSLLIYVDVITLKIVLDIMLSILLYQHNAIEDRCQPTKSSSLMYGLLKDAAQNIVRIVVIN